jgi:hypothetical protein
MKFKKEFEKYLAELFNYDEDAVVENFNNKELYKDFLRERAE